MTDTDGRRGLPSPDTDSNPVKNTTVDNHIESTKEAKTPFILKDSSQNPHVQQLILPQETDARQSASSENDSVPEASLTGCKTGDDNQHEPSSELPRQEKPHEPDTLVKVEQEDFGMDKTDEIDTTPRAAAIDAGASNSEEHQTSCWSDIGDIGHVSIKPEQQSEDKHDGQVSGAQDCDKSNEDAQSDSDADNSDSESDFEDESSDSSEDGEAVERRRRKKQPAPQKSPKKDRLPPAKNAREFMARLHQREDEKRARQEQANRKRKSQDQGARKSKKPKLGQTTDTLSRLLQGNEQSESGKSSATAPLMQDFKARTHAEQFARLRENIPAGADTRRAATQEKDLKEAVRLFGYRKVKATDKTWRLKGMQWSLHGYQITAAAWMVKRELARRAPFGGLLADEMGMGKTVISLACMTGNPPQDDDIKNFSRTTLVVVPNKSIALQWKDEVEKHCEKIGDWVTVYSPKGQSGPRGLAKRTRVLITTYHELIKQYPSAKTLAELREKFGSDDVSYNKALSKKMGELLRSKWYRVILDEAHAIKNIDSRSTAVCCQLVSKYRWALSGTPLANSVLEFFPYLKFLRCSKTTSALHFSNTYMTEGKPTANFEVLVSMVMYRRTMKDSFMGERILNIPESQVHDLWIPLSAEENLLAQFVCDHYRERIRKIQEQKAKYAEQEKCAGKSGPSQEEVHLQYSMAMRMRQSVSHPFNLEKMLRTTITVQECRRLKAKLGDLGAKQPVLDQMMSGGSEESGLERYQTGIQFLRKRGEPVFGGLFQWSKMLDMIENELTIRNVTCSGCKKAKPPVRPTRISHCGHFYCGDCYRNSFFTTRQQPPGKKNTTRYTHATCKEPGCNQSLQSITEFETLQNFAYEKNTPELGRDANGVQISRDESENGCFMASAAGGDCASPPSTKLTATMAILATWAKDFPEDKIIVFVQFIMTGKLLGRMLEMTGLKKKFLYYFGGMSQMQKNKALRDFKGCPERKILIASMKCGGQSLNLTVANRVILVDPWWNNTVERQAFGRVMRHGQQKNSHLVRIFVNASIDSKMSLLQETKSEEIGHALQDDGHIPAEVDDDELQKMFFGPDVKRSQKRHKA